MLTTSSTSYSSEVGLLKTFLLSVTEVSHKKILLGPFNSWSVN